MDLITNAPDAKARAPIPSVNFDAVAPDREPGKRKTQSRPRELSLREVALARAGEGFRVFPLIPGGKTPALEADWKRIASTDPDQIDRWWTCPVTGWEQPYNVGIALDANTVVVDVDVRDGKNGKRNLHLLEELHEPLPVTYRVRTPSKGDHHYFRSDSRRKFAKELTTDVDLKSLSGYVVGEGSIINKIRYARVSGSPDVMVDLPAWVGEVGKATASTDHAAGSGKSVPLVELDAPRAIERATNWLRDHAPDSGTYKVAARVKDFGVSEDMALDLLMEHWVEHKGLAKALDHVALRVRNAFNYGKNPVGSKAPAKPEAEFEPVNVEDSRTAPPSDEDAEFDFKPVQPFDFNSLRPRPWVVDRLAVRQTVTGFIAPAGIGKTTFLIALALSVATGRSDILGFKVRERTRVLLWNQEDPKEELDLRLAAAMEAYGISWSDLELDGRQMLFMESGVHRDKPFRVSKEKNDTPTATPEVERLARFIQREGIGLAVFDPFIELTDSDENNNNKMAAVAGILRNRIAVQCKCSVVLAHHTKKPPEANSSGFAGSMDASRGASSLAGVFRLAWTLFTVAPKDKLGIPESERHRYARLDDAKSNFSLLSGKPRLFRRDGVTVGGFGGEEVAVLRPESAEEVRARFADERQNSRTRFLESIRAVLAAEGGKATVMAVAETLQRDLEFEDRSLESLRKELSRVFESGAICDNGDEISLLKNQSVRGIKGRPNVLFLTTADNLEGVSAKLSAKQETAENQ